MTQKVKLDESTKYGIRMLIEDIKAITEEEDLPFSTSDISNIKKYLRAVLSGKTKDSWWNEHDADDFLDILRSDGFFDPEQWMTESQMKKLKIKKNKIFD